MTSQADAWDELTDLVEALYSAVRKGASVAVNSATVKSDARGVVQFYFRTARPAVVALGIEDGELVELDSLAQSLNDLSQGNNRRSSYKACLNKARGQISSIGIRRHRLVGIRSQGGQLALNVQQTKIVKTLQGMLPSSAAAFARALRDLADESRLSFRGPAAELREVLREVIDHLAPDGAVTAIQGFKFEKDQFGRDRTAPTMKQKVRFIFKNRNRGGAATTTAEEAVAIIESGPDNLARSLYNQGSAATHTARERKEVLGIERYTEVVLADLLELD